MRVLRAAGYTSLLLTSCVLLILGQVYETALSVLLAVAGIAFLAASVVVWYRYVHPVMGKSGRLAVAAASIAALAVLFLFGYVLAAAVPVAQATMAAAGLLEERGWRMVFVRKRWRRYRLGRNVWRSVPRELEVFLYIDLFTAALFIPSVVLGSYLLFLGGELLVSSVGVMLMMYGLAGVFYHAVGLLRPPVEVRVRVLRKRWYTAFLVRHPRVYSLAERYTGLIKRLLVEAGVFRGPLVFASRFFVPALLILVSLGPLAAAAPLLLGGYGLVVAAAVYSLPLILLAAPVVYLSSRRGDRRRRVEDELPWFALYASVMQSAGIPLYESFRRLMGRGVLPAVEAEAAVVERNVRMLGMDQVNAIEALARRHPSRRFSEFLYGYTTILRTGGDLVSYLESRVREYLEALRFRLRRYAERSVDLGEILVSMFFILTSIVVSLALVAGGSALAAVRLYNYVAVPLITVVLYMVIDSIQPRLYDRYVAGHALPAITTPAATLTAVLAGWDPWLVVASFAVGLAGGYGVQYYAQQRVIAAQERALPDFLRDIAEYRKIGLPVTRALLAVAEKRRYNPVFDELLGRIAFQARMHRRLNEIPLHTGSWLVRMVFFILGEIEASGGGTVRVLEELVGFVQEYNIARNEMRGMLRLYELLAYTAPIMLVLTVSLITGLTAAEHASWPATAAMEQQWVFTPEIHGLDPALLSEIKTSTILASLALAILTSKTIDYTVRNTLRAVTVVLITIAAFTFLQPVAETMIKSLI